MTKATAPLITSATLVGVVDECNRYPLSFLYAREVCLISAVSKVFRMTSKEEIRQRANYWLKETSRAWKWGQPSDEPWADDGKIDASADDTSINDERALNMLDSAWTDIFTTPAELLEGVADWCGGWPRLLDAREKGAPSQPQLVRGASIHLTTLDGIIQGDDDEDDDFSFPCPVGLIWDIYCDGWHKWSGVYPLCARDLAQIDVGGISSTAIFPFHSKSLGDATTTSTVVPDRHGEIFPRYLFSTDADDTRNWMFSISMVSPKSYETLLFSQKISPKNMVEYIYEAGSDESDEVEDVDGTRSRSSGSWETDGGYEETMERKRKHLEAGYSMHSAIKMFYERVTFDENLWRCSDLDPVTRVPAYPRPIGLKSDGTVADVGNVQCWACYWLERKNGSKNRFHLCLDFSCDDTFWGEVILNARSGNESSVSSRPVKRRQES